MQLIKLKDTFGTRYRLPKGHVEYHYWSRNVGTEDAALTIGMKSGQQLILTIDVEALIEFEDDLGVRQLRD
jgi:hypothetical protein